MDWQEKVREGKALLAAATEADREAKSGVRQTRIELSRARRALARRRNDLALAIERVRSIDPEHPFIPEAEQLLESTAARVQDLAAATSRGAPRRVVYPPPPLVEGHVVYFVQARSGGPIKIGTTRDLQRRLASMQAGSPVELVVLATVPGDSRTENALHKRLTKYRLHGEWFLDTEEVRAAMKGALQ